MVPAVLWLRDQVSWLDGDAAFGMRLLWLLATIGVGTAVFAATMLVVGGDDARALRSRLRRRSAVS